MMNTLNGMEKAVDINVRMSTLDARISKCIEDALEPFWRELRARGLVRGHKQHDSHTPCDQHSSHIIIIVSHNLNTEPIPTKDSSHISNTEPHNLNTEPTLTLHPAPALHTTSLSPPSARDTNNSTNRYHHASLFANNGRSWLIHPLIIIIIHGNYPYHSCFCITRPTTKCIPATRGSTTLGSIIHHRSSTHHRNSTQMLPKVARQPTGCCAYRTPCFQDCWAVRGDVFAIHFHLHICMSDVLLDTLLLCALPPIYKHEFQPPPVKAISCL